MTYDYHLRAKAFLLFNSFIGSFRQAFLYIGLRLLIHPNTVRNWLIDAGNGVLGPLRKRRAKQVYVVDDNHIAVLINHLKTCEPQMYAKEMVLFLFSMFGAAAVYTPNQVLAALKRHGITKKLLTRWAKEQDAVQRLAFRHLVRNFPAHMFVFADETHSNVGDARRKYGWGEKGQAAFHVVLNSNGKTEGASGICSMNVKGMFSVHVTDQSITADYFCDVLESEIFPRMMPFNGVNPNSILFLDNASPHHKNRIEQLRQRFGVLVLYLPQYSYDYNPIEVAFHNAKHRLRSTYWKHDVNRTLARQLEVALWNAVTPDIACNLFEHCYISVDAATRAYANN